MFKNLTINCLSVVAITMATTGWAQSSPLTIKASADLGAERLEAPFVIKNTNSDPVAQTIASGANFMPSLSTGFTVEFEAKAPSTTGRGVDVAFRSNNGKGAIYSVAPSYAENYANATRLCSNADNTTTHTYRMSVLENTAYFFRDHVYIGETGLNALTQKSKIKKIYSTQNKISDPGFEGVAADAAPAGEWATIPAGRLGSSNKYTRVIVDANSNWQTTGAKCLFVRMREGTDSNLSCNVLNTKITGLTGGAHYKFSFKYKGHKDYQGSIKVMAVANASDYTDDSKSLGTIAGTVPEATAGDGNSAQVKTLTIEFDVPSNLSSAYLVFVRDGNANFYLDDFELYEEQTVSVDAQLSIGKYFEGGAEMEISSLKYDLTGAYAPVSPNTTCFTPLYSENLVSDFGFDGGFEKTNSQGFSTLAGIYKGVGGAAIETTSAKSYCGNNSGTISGTGALSITLNDLVAFSSYKFRAMVKNNGGTYEFSVTNYNGPASSLRKTVSTNGEWSRIEIDFSTGLSTAATTISLTGTVAGGEVWTDNWELYALSTGSPTEGVITTTPLTEQEIKSTIVDILAKSTGYGESQYKTDGYFGNGQNNEHGARSNADWAFIYAFLCKYGQSATYPAGISLQTVKDHALKAIRFSYSTHKTGTKNCTNNAKWGLCWESSLWSASLAYAGWAMWGDLTQEDKDGIKKVVIAEANYNLARAIPTKVNSDTKAEENGWDTNILSIAASMYPEEPNAEAWDYRCKQFGANTYSTFSDSYNKSVIDGKCVRDWYIGANLYDDYALENHDFFHTSYLNVPIQELSESYLSYKALQDKNAPVFEMPATLKHNVKEVWDNLLKELATADGELAMPNGNDWSMYLYDQLSSYAAIAAIYRDADALMLESLALKYTQARQNTTTNGAFMLRPDVGERRMGVTGRRLVFAYLYHEFFSTADMQPNNWETFSSQHEKTKLLPYNKIIRNNTKDRFVTFSWFQSQNKSTRSYMGMITANSVDKAKIVFPYKTGNVGNFTGFMTVEGKSADATLIGETYNMYPKSFVTTGKLAVNASSLNQYISFYATPGNAVIYMDEMVGAASGKITKEAGLLLGISTDIFTKETRTLYDESGSKVVNGTSLVNLSGNWLNVDDSFGAVLEGSKGIAFGDKAEEKSIMVSKLYGSYSTTARTFVVNEKVASRSGIYYSNTNARTTADLSAAARYPKVAAGWKAAAAQDPNGACYLLLTNFTATTGTDCELSMTQGAPVFDRVTTISGTKGKAFFKAPVLMAQPQELYVFLSADKEGVQAVQADNDPHAVYLKNTGVAPVSLQIKIVKDGVWTNGTVALEPAATLLAEVKGGTIEATDAAFPGNYRNVAKGKHVYATSQWPANFPFAVIDEDPDTYWMSLAKPNTQNPQSLTVRLQGSYKCDKIILAAAEKGAPADIEIQVSNDDKTYTSVASKSLDNTTEPQTISFTATTAQYVRVVVKSTFAEEASIASLQVMGSPVE